MGPRGYVTLIMWREEGFVFSGEQLALVFQLQHEGSNAAEGQTITIIYNHYNTKTSYIFLLLYLFFKSKKKRTQLNTVDISQYVQLPISVNDNGCIIFTC